MVVSFVSFGILISPVKEKDIHITARKKDITHITGINQ